MFIFIVTIFCKKYLVKRHISRWSIWLPDTTFVEKCHWLKQVGFQPDLVYLDWTETLFNELLKFKLGIHTRVSIFDCWPRSVLIPAWDGTLVGSGKRGVLISVGDGTIVGYGKRGFLFPVEDGTIVGDCPRIVLILQICQIKCWK